jgi:transcriptional regulator with XRE-family HTH domain
MPETLSAPDRLRARLVALVGSDPRPASAIAEAAGMSRQQLGQVLSGHRPNPTVATLGRILEALGRGWRDLD